MTLEEAKSQLRTRHEARSLARDQIPKLPGVYVWSIRESGEVVYVGKASGRAGLRGRIWGQHLNPRYLETREAKFQTADAAQLACTVLSGGKIGVDKSVFRRSIGRKFGLAPGAATVAHIRENLAIAWVSFTSEMAAEIPRIELELIRDFAPQLKVSGTRSNNTG